MKLQTLFAVASAIWLGSCGQGPSASAVENGAIVTVRMLSERTNAYIGFSVRVRGFLIANGPELNMLSKEAANPTEPYIVIHDESLVNENNGRVETGADLLFDLGCLNNNVELLGIVGRTLRGPVGIVKILKVDLMRDVSASDGTTCYEARG